MQQNQHSYEFSKDIKNYLTTIDKRYQKHPIVDLLSGFGITPKTMVEVFDDNKIISRGTVYNVFGGYCKKVPRKVENVLLRTLKQVTEQAITIANTEKDKHKLETLNQVKEVIINAKKYLQGLDEIDTAVFDMGVLEENKHEKKVQDEEYIKAYIEHLIV